MNLCVISSSFVLLFCIIRNSISMSHSDTRNSSSSSSVPIKKRRIRLSSVSETPAKICSKKVTAVEEEEVATMEAAAVDAEANKNTCNQVVESGHSKIISCASNSDEIRYLDSLSAIERNVCLIAKEHLQSSFDLSRSSGFISWKRDNL